MPPTAIQFLEQMVVPGQSRDCSFGGGNGFGKRHFLRTASDLGAISGDDHAETLTILIELFRLL